MKIFSLIIITLFVNNSFASDTYKYKGPLLELKCSLTKKGEGRQGTDLKIGKTPLILKIHPKADSVTLSTTALKDKSSVKELISQLGENCQGDFSGISKLLLEEIDNLRARKVHKLLIREFDPILFDFIKTANKENCSLKKANNIDSKWILSYNIKDPRC